MPTNINSFADNMNTLVSKVNDVLSVTQAINESMAGTDAEIVVKNNDSSTTLPSYSNVIQRLNRAENTIATFTRGYGVVETDDGTYRKISVESISRPPQDITNNAAITQFAIDPNWFFESLQYPRCVIKLDLAGQIDAASDRVYVNRVILDSTGTASNGTLSMLDFYNANIAGQNLNYQDLIALLEQYGISYREDKEEIDFPLTYEQYAGEFAVQSVRLLKDENGTSQIWYFLDTLNYSEVDENGYVLNNTHVLDVNDYVRFDDALFKVVEISQNQRRVRLEYAVGYSTIGQGSVLELYNQPFAEKIVEIGIGINEIDIVYVKGVNETYNLLSRNWSNPIEFYTNNLTFEDSPETTFASYYAANVADFGATWIAQAKEKQISAYNGLKPYAPVLNLDDLEVVQINTQLDATLDSETYTQLTSEIASTKSNITSLRQTIASNKDLLIQSSTQDERENIQNLIDTDTTSLNTYTTQYNSLVEELNTLLNEAGAIGYSPKYHVRGFFSIPQPRYTDESNRLGEQAVIGFEIKYRYLHTDETGIKLNTFEYTGSDNIIQTGVFTDWNLVTSKIVEKVYDASLDTYYWNYDRTTDGDAININQIDIPIRSGEKVEIKVRSISEAGYPYNPLKSDWSNSVIVSFPDNLTSNDSVTTMLETVKDDMTAVTLQQTMTAAGVYTHLADSNSTYKHTSTNISYTDITYDSSGKATNVVEVSLQEKIDELVKQINNLTSQISTLTQP